MFFFFNDTATTEIYTLSLHDALPIYLHRIQGRSLQKLIARNPEAKPVVQSAVLSDPADLAIVPFSHIERQWILVLDRKSTRLNSSHGYISYAVFCLKKKKTLTHS